MFGKKKPTAPASSSSSSGVDGYAMRKAFANAMDAKGIKYRLDDERPVVRITYNGKNYESLTFTFIFDEDGKSFALRVFSIANFTPDQLADAYEFCNAMNCKYRWLHFYVDSDNDFTASADAVLDYSTAGAECCEFLSRAVSMLEDVCEELNS